MGDSKEPEFLTKIRQRAKEREQSQLAEERAETAEAEVKKQETQCPSCGKTLIVPDDAVGRKGKCLACGKVFKIQAPEEPPVELAPDPSQEKEEMKKHWITILLHGAMFGLGLLASSYPTTSDGGLRRGRK